MANRNFNRAQNLEKEVKGLFADVAIGGSGVSTLTKGLGVTSVARDSAGVYIVTLDDKYNRLMKFGVIALSASVLGLTFELEAEDVDGAKTIQFRAVGPTAVGDTTPIETEIPSGTRLLIDIQLKNSTAGE